MNPINYVSFSFMCNILLIVKFDQNRLLVNTINSLTIAGFKYRNTTEKLARPILRMSIQEIFENEDKICFVILDHMMLE